MTEKKRKITQKGKVALITIGPIHPLRGGIAHSNRIISESLQKRNTITAISFKRLYPKILFPGKSQKEQKEDKEYKIKTTYLIDSINPLTWIKTANKIKQQKPNWILFHHWHTAFIPCYWTIAHLVKKDPEIKISVICHNYTPHNQGSKIHQLLIKQFLKKADNITALSSNIHEQIKRDFPRKAGGWITEPTYNKAMGKEPNITREQAQQRLGIAGNTILFFGFIRPYKGLKYLINAIPLILKEIPITLLIAGEFWEKEREHLKRIKKKNLGNNILLHSRYIPTEEVKYYFKASNAIVLPYTTTTNSAVLKMAFGYNLPIITTNIKGNTDIIEDGKTGILIKPKSAKEIAKSIIRFFKQGKERGIKRNMKKAKGIFKWNKRKEQVLFN